MKDEIVNKLISRNIFRNAIIFKTAYETGSYRKASEKLHMSIGNISNHIADLEYDLRIKIVSKNKNIELQKRFTTEAALLYKYIKSFDQNLSDFIQQINSIN